MSFMTGEKTPMQYTDVDPAAYQTQFLDAQTDHLLLDVRTPNEFMNVHLPDALNIPLQELPNRWEEIPNDKPVVIVCQTGNRSVTASLFLLRTGLTEVYNLTGGTMLWMMQQRPLVR